MLIKLTHANFLRPLMVDTAHIAAYYFSEKDKATHLISVGAIFPVVESVEEVTRLILGQDGPINTSNESTKP